MAAEGTNDLFSQSAAASVRSGEGGDDGLFNASHSIFDSSAKPVADVDLLKDGNNSTDAAHLPHVGGIAEASKNADNDWGDGDDFGDFVETAACAVGPCGHQAEELGVSDGNEGQCGAMAAIPSAAKVPAWGTGSRTAAESDLRAVAATHISGLQNLPDSNLKNGIPNNDDVGVDDDNWMEFHDGVTALAPSSQPRLPLHTGGRPAMGCGLAASLSLLSGGGQFDFEKDFDTALLARQLYAFTGCTADNFAGSSRKVDYQTNSWARGNPSDQRGSYSAGDIVTAMLEAFFFRRRKPARNVTSTFQGVGTLFAAHVCESAARKVQGAARLSSVVTVSPATNGKAEELWDVVGEVDPTTAVRIAELHSIRFFSSADSLLLQPEAQEWQVAEGPIPICDVIARVKALNAEQHRQQQQQPQPTQSSTPDLWSVHPLLPIPHIGSSVSFAPSLQLPF